MKIALKIVRPLSSRSAFTMVEIALSLAIIGFALVAIIGVLPTGMQVQKENRQETIINQDATIFIDAIRSGAQGLDDLTNYVMAITNDVHRYNSNGKLDASFSATYGYKYASCSSSINKAYWLTNGLRIVGLLSTPKYVPWPATGHDSGGYYSNYVVAYVRSLSGPVSEKFPQNNASVQDLAFSYRLNSEVVPCGTNYWISNSPWDNTQVPNLQTNLQALQFNLHDLRLTFRWPLLNSGGKTSARQVFRTLAGGFLQETNEPAFQRPYQGQPSPFDLYFFQPRSYVNAP